MNIAILKTKESREVVDQIAEMLRKEGECKVTGLGIFVVIDVKARQGRNPKTGEKITIAARKKIKLRLSSAFKGAVL